MVRLRGNAQNGIHRHVQDAAMRHDEVTSRLAVEDGLDGATRPQVDLEAAFTGLAEAGVRG